MLPELVMQSQYWPDVVPAEDSIRAGQRHRRRAHGFLSDSSGMMASFVDASGLRQSARHRSRQPEPPAKNARSHTAITTRCCSTSKIGRCTRGAAGVEPLKRMTSSNPVDLGWYAVHTRALDSTVRFRRLTRPKIRVPRASASDRSATCGRFAPLPAGDLARTGLVRTSRPGAPAPDRAQQVNVWGIEDEISLIRHCARPEYNAGGRNRSLQRARSSRSRLRIVRAPAG